MFDHDLPFEAGDPFVDELGCRRVVADDDEDGRDANAGSLPLDKFALVVVVEGEQGRGEQIGKLVAGIELTGLAGALLRHLLADVIPKIAEHRYVGIDRVVAHRDPGQLDDAALDGVDE